MFFDAVSVFEQRAEWEHHSKTQDGQQVAVDGFQTSAEILLTSSTALDTTSARIFAPSSKSSR